MTDINFYCCVGFLLAIVIVIITIQKGPINENLQSYKNRENTRSKNNKS